MNNDSFLIALTDDVISYFYPFSIDIALVYTSTCSEACSSMVSIKLFSKLPFADFETLIFLHKHILL